MEYICQSCKQANPPTKWHFFGTVCPECKQPYIPKGELVPYYRTLANLAGSKHERSERSRSSSS